MNTPGVSLFQGAESLQINTSIEREEEAEALEDQRRRNEELGNLLQNAFDDLEEDNTTVDSTTNFPADTLPPYNNPEPQVGMPRNQATPVAATAHPAYGNEMHRLQMLLESRTNELENIKQMANEDYRKRDELQKRLLITQAELDRALNSKKDTHELLVESKEKCSNLENTIVKLRQDKKSLESENNELLGKLETAQALLSDVQRKYDMVERDLNRGADRNAEARRKQLEDKHRAEIEMLHQQIEQYTNKVEKKSSELESMHARYNALQSSHEAMLLDKASIINDLSNALSEAQHKCEEFSRKPDYSQENMRLQKLVCSLEAQIAGMEKTITTLQERLDFTNAELNVVDSVLQQHNMDLDTPLPFSHTQGKVLGSTPLNTNERMGNLRSELYRALENVKAKRDEIRKLQQLLEERNSEIRMLKEAENKFLVQLTTLKEDKLRLENRLKTMEAEQEELRAKSQDQNFNNSKLRMLNEEIAQLRQEKQAIEAKCALLERERNRHEFEHKKLDAQLKNVEVDLEELKQEYDSMKRNYEQMQIENKQLRGKTQDNANELELEKHKFLLRDAQAECDRLKNLYVEISNAKEALAFEVEKLHKADNMKELQELRGKVANLTRALQLAEVKCMELSKILETEKLCHERDVRALKEKFEKEKNQLLEAKQNADDCVKCVEHKSEISKLEVQNLKTLNTNSMVRQEMEQLTQELKTTKQLAAELTEKLKLSKQQEQVIAELKTKAQKFEEYIKSQSNSNSSDKSVNTSPELDKAELKRVESRIREEMAKIFANELKRFQLRLQETEQKMHGLQLDYDSVLGELQQRQNEVELLKRAILVEREKMNEILKEKDQHYEAMLQKQSVMLHKSRDELKAKNQRVLELCKELDERQTQISAERQSMKAVMEQWEQQRQHFDTINEEWKEKLHEMEEAHSFAMRDLREKYRSAKRTAANYKRYEEDKSAHMQKEFERLKLEYQKQLAQLEARMRETLERKQIVLQDAVLNAEKRRELGVHNKENVTSSN